MSWREDARAGVQGWGKYCIFIYFLGVFRCCADRICMLHMMYILPEERGYSENDNPITITPPNVYKYKCRRQVSPVRDVPTSSFHASFEVELRPLRFLRGLSTLVWPELDVAGLTQAPPPDELALLAHDILDGLLLVAKDAEMVTDDVAVAAVRAGDEGRPPVVPLLGDVVVRAVTAGDAGEGELVVCLIRNWSLALGPGRLVRRVVLWVGGSGLRSRDGMGGAEADGRRGQQRGRSLAQDCG